MKQDHVFTPSVDSMYGKNHVTFVDPVVRSTNYSYTQAIIQSFMFLLTDTYNTGV